MCNTTTANHQYSPFHVVSPKGRSYDLFYLLYILFTHKHIMVPENLNITIGAEAIPRKDTVKCLGMYIDSKLDWFDHIQYVRNVSSLYAMRKVKHILTTDHLLLTLYYSLIYIYI